MPCLLVVIALAAPRLVVALLWFFTSWFAGLFASPCGRSLALSFCPPPCFGTLRFCGSAVVQRAMDSLARRGPHHRTCD